jgi:hypothetical protein
MDEHITRQLDDDTNTDAAAIATYFDDILPAGDSPDRRAALKEAIIGIVKIAQTSRLPPPPVIVAPFTQFSHVDVLGSATVKVAPFTQFSSLDVIDPAYSSVTVLGELPPTVDDVLAEILGDTHGAHGAAFAPATSPNFPITQGLYRKYSAGVPAKRVVRVDTEGSYPGWRSTVAGEAVPLSLPPSTEGNVKCWQDGASGASGAGGAGCIYVSIRLPGPDGQARIASSSTPAARHIEDVLGYTVAAGYDPMEMMEIIPGLANIMGGGDLVTQLCCAVEGLLARPEVAAQNAGGSGPFIGVVSVDSDPQLLAVMALLQRCQRGDAVALAEAKRLVGTSGGAIVRDACRCLAEAQARKADQTLRRVL